MGEEVESEKSVIPRKNERAPYSVNGVTFVKLVGKVFYSIVKQLVRIPFLFIKLMELWCANEEKDHIDRVAMYFAFFGDSRQYFVAGINVSAKIKAFCKFESLSSVICFLYDLVFAF